MIKEFIKKNNILIFLIFLALLLRFPWLYTTIENDEGSFGYAAWRMLEGESYESLSENKPPFLYVLYALPIYFFGNSIIPIRIFNNILFIISIIFFFKLIEYFFEKRTALFAILFYVIFMNIPVFEGYLAMSESLLIPFLIMSLYFFQKYISFKKIFLLLISSVLILATIMIKQQAIFVYFLIITGLFVYKEKGKIKKIFLILSPLLLIVIIIHVLNNQFFIILLKKTWSQVTVSPRGFSLGYNPFDYNLLIILEGSLLWLFSIIGIIKSLKSRFKENIFFVFFWLIFAFIFTITPPAYGHYYIFLIPPLAIFSGIGCVYVINSKQSKKVFVLVTVILVMFTLILWAKHYPDSTLKLGQLHWGWSSMKSYQEQVLLSSYIKNVTSIEDNILLVGWEPSIYWMSGRIYRRHIVSYLSSDLPLYWEFTCLTNKSWNEIEKKIRIQENLKMIILMPSHQYLCESGIKIFPNLPKDYNQIEIADIKIYIKSKE